MSLYSLQGYEGSTALSIACENGHSETARILLDHGAAINIRDKVRTSMNVHTSQSQKLSCYVHDFMVSPSQKGQSPLVLACVGGHTETVKVLLESKLVQVNLQNDVS